MSDYISPEYKAKSYQCPHCGVYAQQKWLELSLLLRSDAMGASVGYDSFRGLEITQCTHCNLYGVWEYQTLVYPVSSIAPSPSPDMPEDVAKDFNEARSVLASSPRSSAALLRLALQRLCQHLGLPGKNINEDIASLVKEGLSPKVKKALDIVRVIGNNAVHPGKIDLDDNQPTALLLFNLVNFIVEQTITLQRLVDETYEELPKEVLQQIERRDRTNKTS